MMNKERPPVVSHLSVIVLLVLVHFKPISSDQKLRFGQDGRFKVLQVADMHYADGKTTPCLDVLPTQVAGCSDLNTTAFLNRMILAERPDLIVFTGNFCFPFLHL